MESCGMVPADDALDADLLIVNTCSVRAKAEDKLVSYLGAAQAARERNPNLKVGLVGCTATLIGDELKKRFPIVEFILPATEVDSFPDRLMEHIPGLSIFSTDIPSSVTEKERLERFVTVMRGCEMFCSYCVVPHARGKVRSLPLSEIHKRCDEAISQGCRVLTLLGQNVMAYGRNPIDESDAPSSFEDLLRDIAAKYPETWIKFLTSHPRDVTTGLIDFITSMPNISRHFHLPIQSGDDGVLKDMNRGYTSAEYRKLISYIREKIPESRLSTDVIAGFPTEDDEAFENTLSLAREIEFDQMFTFQYSPREGTTAYKREDSVPFEAKRDRLHKLIEIQNEIAKRKNEKLIGKRMNAIIYGPTDREDASLMAVTRESHIVVIPPGNYEAGEMVDVEITKGLLRTLEGRVII
jgi:tRNA-2-methylthio-N6-dimethylallyladenosine synthase